MLDHVGIVVSDSKKTSELYSKLLLTIDLKLLDQKFNWSGYGLDYPYFWVGEKKDKPTSSHVAFSTGSKDKLRYFFEMAISLGATDNAEPKTRSDFYQEQYGAFILDVDGNSIGIIHQ